ncbi:MAG: LuxR C-terminal-related transcriptional regulator [Myxococcota bacterium]
MSVDWEVIGPQLLERERRPVMVLDERGRVIRTNQAFRYLVSDGRHTVGADFTAQWLTPDSRPHFLSARERAITGDRTRVTVRVVESIFPLDLMLELTCVGVEPTRYLLAVVVDLVPRRQSSPLIPAGGLLYEVVTNEHGPWQLKRLVTPQGEQEVDVDPTPCFRKVFGLSAECRGCPVKGIGRGGQAHGVVQAPSPDFRAHLLVARNVTQDTTSVLAFPVETETYTALVEARVHHLSSRAKLSERERQLLQMLLLGRSLKEAAGVLGITARTAKYHQQNLLRKVGADGRVDLFRLLL